MAIDLGMVTVEKIEENPEDYDCFSSDERSEKKSRKHYFCFEENCTASFNRRDRLRYHMRKHTGERPYVCLYDECKKSYARASHLKRHMQNVHEPRAEILLICSFPQCEKQFKSQVSLDNHIKNIHKKRKYVCKTCLKPFRKHQHLKIHEYEHTGIKPFLCSHIGCDRSFLLPSRLKRHMKVHAGYNCDVAGCYATFRTWTLLIRHRKACHQTSYTCDTCKKVFNTRYNLQLHLKIHDEEQEIYHCPYPDCPRYYIHERNLQPHIKSYHEEHEFRCTVSGCKARFAHKVSLKKHIKRHNNPTPSKQKEKRELLKSNEQNKCKRRRKRKSSQTMGSDVAAFLSNYNKNEIENSGQETICVVLDQQIINDTAKDGDSCVFDQQNIEDISQYNHCSKKSINVSISDFNQKNIDLDSCTSHCNKENPKHVSFCMYNEQNIESVIVKSY